MNTERTPEQKKDAAREIYDGLEEGKYEDRSRFSLEVEDPRRFLENYARIGLIKERLEKVLSSGTWRTEIETSEKEETKEVTKKAAIQRGDLVILPGNKEIRTAGMMKHVLGQLLQASKENPIKHSKLVLEEYGEALAAGKITMDQARAGIDRIYTRLKTRLQKEAQLTIINAVPAGDRFEGKGSAYFLEELSKPSVPILPIEPIEPVPDALQILTPGTIIEYQLPERELRTEEETKILSLIIRGLSQHQFLYYEDIQRELHYLHENEQPVYVYKPRELKQKFDAAYKKMSTEYVVPRRFSRWTDDDKMTWERIERLISIRYEGDILKFRQGIKTSIDNAERRFKDKFNQG